jgi:hypothetical protein
MTQTRSLWIYMHLICLYSRNSRLFLNYQLTKLLDYQCSAFLCGEIQQKRAAFRLRGFKLLEADQRPKYLAFFSA